MICRKKMEVVNRSSQWRYIDSDDDWVKRKSSPSGTLYLKNEYSLDNIEELTLVSLPFYSAGPHVFMTAYYCDKGEPRGGWSKDLGSGLSNQLCLHLDVSKLDTEDLPKRVVNMIGKEYIHNNQVLAVRTNAFINQKTNYVSISNFRLINFDQYQKIDEIIKNGNIRTPSLLKMMSDAQDQALKIRSLNNW